MLSRGIFINITQTIPAHLILEEARTRRGCGILPRDTQLSTTEPRLRRAYLRVSQKAEDSGHGRTQSPELAEQVPRATDSQQGFLKTCPAASKALLPQHTQWSSCLCSAIPWVAGFSLLCLTNRLLTSSDPKAIRNKQEPVARGSHVNRWVSSLPFPEA